MSASAQSTKAPKRALVVIDTQNEYFTGNLLIEYPAPKVSLNNVGLAMDAARAAGVPILVVQHTAPHGAPIFQKGKPEWELHEVVKIREYDHYVEKSLPSIFTGTDAATWFKKNEIDTLTIVGYMTQNCNASTIYHAMHDGYKVEMLSDATGAVPYANEAGSATAEEIHRVLSVIFHSNFAAIVSTSDWIHAVNTGVPIVKSNVPASNRGAQAQKVTAQYGF